MASDETEPKTNMLSAVKNKLLGRPKLLTVCWAVFGLSVAGLFTWTIVVNDPLGGEPVAIVELGAKSKPSVAENTDKLGMRTSMRPEDAPSVSRPEAAPETNVATAEHDVLMSPEPEAVASQGLPRAPAKGLTEKIKLGVLPRIGDDGRRPSQIYARKLDGDATASPSPVRIAIFVGGMGLSATGTQSAIDILPEQVTLGFAPYGRKLQSWVHKARAQGHEILLQIPMEPFDFPDNDPGPYTLLTKLSAEENLSRLNWLMTRFVGYAGVTNYMGARFTSTREPMKNAFAEFARRGLIYVDNGASQRSLAKTVGQKTGLGVSVADVVIDANPSKGAIDIALSNLEAIAQRRGVAIGYASGLPLSVKRIAKWAQSLSRRGIVLVPVTATVPAGQT